MPSANVIPFPSREKLSCPREDYLIRHEEKTDLLRDGVRRVVSIRKTFFDGRERVELEFETEYQRDAELDEFLARVDDAVQAYFCS